MADALQSILTQAGLALAPLSAVDTPAKAVIFFKQLGYDIPPGAFGPALNGLSVRGSGLLSAVQDLVEASDDTAIITAIVNTGAQLAGTIDAIVSLHTEIQTGGGAALPGINELPERMTDFLILDAFNRLNPAVHGFMHALGLIENEEIPISGQPIRKINWNRLGLVFSDPSALFDQTYNWSTSFDHNQFLNRVDGIMRGASLPGGIYPQSDTTRVLLGNTSNDLNELRFPIIHKGVNPESYTQFGLTFSPVEGTGGKKPGIAILPYLMGTSNFDFSVCDKGELVFNSTGQIDGIGLIIRPPMNTEALLDLAASFGAELILRQKPSVAPEIVLLGTAGGTRLAIQGLGMSSFVRNDGAKLDIGWEGHIDALRLVITGGDGDGFLQEILSSVNVTAEAEIGFGYSLLGGFYFTGGAKLGIDLPVHIDLGPLVINGLRVELQPKSDQLALQAGANIQLTLGPLNATVENIGIEASFFFRQGNLGPMDMELGFKPPNGVGLSVDAGVVKGGGYLFFDFDKGEYAGALELTFSEIVSLKAIGLINTKMPDGSDGFSLIIIITAEFGTGIQLGFGFTLLGVGGLLGLNRTMRLDALAEGVRTGSTENIMFPTNVVENAPRIISDLRNFFPIEQGKFLIGPMAKLGWGTPTLISISLGIIIEIPGNIAILGILKIALPTEEAALIVLQINFIGAIEFDKERLWFFASMYDSRVLFITLEGEMGLLVGWGSESNFVSSVGGFHPAFNPPPLPFPNPVRISLNILNESWGRIRVMGYFAVTSNTAQFGARAELYFGVSAFNIDGHIGFDALFQFSPFYMIIQLSASLSVKVFGIGLFSVKVKMSLEGPSPWHAKGTGSISLLFWDIDVDFDFTWGEEKDTKLPPISVMPLLVAEYEKQENWKALVPANNTLFVSLKEIDDVAELVLHPVGSLQITQRAIPLKLSLDKFGTQKPDDANNFILETADSELAKINDLKEKFAIAQFVDLKDAEKLSSPSYQLIEGGVELSVAGEQLATGKSVKRHIRYELITIDTNYKRGLKRFFGFITSLFNVFLRGNSVARAEVSHQTQKNLKPFDELIVVQEPGYSVANTNNNTLYGTTATFGSQAQAKEFMNSQINAQPELLEELHVIPNHEINTAA